MKLARMTGGPSREKHGGNKVPVAGDEDGAATGTENRAQPQLVAVVGIPSADKSEPLLKNGGFDKELAPWICEHGKIAQDPSDNGNSVLEASLEDGRLRLVQAFQRRVGNKNLSISLRVKTTASEQKPLSGFELHLFDKEDKILYSSVARFEDASEWIIMKSDLAWYSNVQKREPVLIMIESIGGEGKFWIDDVILKQAELSP